MKTIKKKSNRGISVMEFLIGLAIVTVLIAFIAPRLQQDSGWAELNKTASEFQYHVETARHEARQQGGEITLHFRKELRSRNHSISYTLPGEPNLAPVQREYVLPESVRLNSDFEFVRFNAEGNAELATPVELASEKNSLLHERFLIR